MLIKLALSNIKNRLRDYIVLLTGLVMSSAIFYMFADLATNQDFIKANADFKNVIPVFYFGEVLLVIITFVYVMYANTFLLNMRLHDYGLFMMLGAKKRRVGALMVTETLFIGIISAIIGIVLGIGLTGGIAGFLFKHLGLTLKAFNPIYSLAIWVTLGLYLILFILAAILNLQKLIKMPILAILNQTDRVDKLKTNGFKLFFAGILGLIFLGIGYFALYKIDKLQLMSIPIALVTIVAGSFLLFKSSMTLVLRALKKSNFAKRKLNNFTLSQIMFRIRDYNKILTITSLLFALALGAITVGAGFNRQIDWMAKAQSAYTLALNNPNQHEEKLIKQLKDAKTVSYDQKYVGKSVYYNEEQFKKHPFVTVKVTDSKNQPLKDPKLETVSLSKLKKDIVDRIDFIGLSGLNLSLKSKIVSQSQFNSLKAPKQTVQTVTVDDISTNYKTLKKLNNIQSKTKVGHSNYVFDGAGSFPVYLVITGVYGGLEFMGYFLGIAFLAMLASCLMFKILSGAASDQIRYNMLTKIGTRRRLIEKSINREILVLFALPGLLGIADVLFGLQMFRVMLIEPYKNIQYPILIFIVLYFGYYYLTTWLYKKIVLTK